MIVFLLSLFLMPTMINGDGDLGRHITIGEVLIETRSILREDIFSHTMQGEELVLHEWLSDLIFALVYRASGLDGIAWMTAAIIAGTYAMLTAGLKFLNVRTFIRLLAGFAAFLVGAIHWHTRPHIYHHVYLHLFCHLIGLLLPNWTLESLDPPAFCHDHFGQICTALLSLDWF